MFGRDSMMGGSNPFSTMNYDELQRNYQMQMERLNKLKPLNKHLFQY